MPVTLITTQKDITRRKKRLTVKGTVSGAYTPGGDPMDLSTTTNPSMISGGKLGSNPQFGRVVKHPSGYIGELVGASTLQGWALKVFISPGNELPAAAYPAALLADPFYFDFEGPLGAF
jgi:hypothetical protein